MTDDETLGRIFDDTTPAASLGIRIRSYDGKVVVVNTPLDMNRNDKGTAFAGSIYSSLVLSGSALVSLLLQDRGLQAAAILVKSSTEYHAPVTDSTFQSCARLMMEDSPDGGMGDLLRSIQTKGRGKINVRCEVTSGDIKCVSFHGLFVVILSPKMASAL